MTKLFIFRGYSVRVMQIAAGALSALMLTGCNVEGVVTIDGNPQSGVAVTVSNYEESLITTTDNNGEYSFKLPGGSYYVEIAPPQGYTGNAGRRIFKSSDDTSVTDVNFTLDTSTAVSTAQGTFFGHYEDNGVMTYQGIRAAKAPVGERRWAAPEPVADSTDNILAVAPGDMCIQLGDKLNAAPTSLYGEMVGGEDCLYLNIWKPANAAATDELPVMLWIYGGGNSLGESSTYTGKYLAETYGVVVVNFNYRMGPLGWFSLPDMHNENSSAETQSGNYGTLDQVNALRWVNRHIASFGGDPENVMVFGESAGASATLAMLASPLTEGLFHKAAIQSAALGWITDHTIWQPRAVAENLADDIEPGYPSSTSEILVSALQRDGLATDRTAAIELQDTLSQTQLADYLKGMSPQALYSLYNTKLGAFLDMPTIVQDGTVIPAMDVKTTFSTGEYHKVPVILGTNRDEYKLFLLSREDYTTEVADTVPLIQNSGDYQLAGKYYSEAWGITSMYELADAMSQNQDDVYVYRFDWDEEPNLVVLNMANVLGAAHGLEIGYTMNNPDLAVTPSLTFALFTNKNKAGRTYLADTMSSYWANLALAGSPAQGVDSNLPQWTTWTTDISAERLMAFDTQEDQGTRMIADSNTMDDLKSRVQAKTGFDSESRYCNLYTEIFGADAFISAICN
jgi:para-nitrobenzyl esterase